MASVSFDHVGKTYAVDEPPAVVDFTLEIDDGQLVVLVGPSGCGKTTALRMVAGLEEITVGVVRIGDRVVNHVAARDRDIAMVFQSYALYPHLDVYDNIAFSLKLRGVKKDEIDERVRRAATLLGLDEFLKRKPRALSGGQRQRVAMGRAIVRQPAAFLMDEPLSNLDAKLRVQMRAEISELQRSLGITTIYVTHDQVEAMTLGDRVAVMRKGVLQQVDHPETLYERPVNLFVGGFIGSPAMNVMDARLERDDGELAVAVGEWRIPLSDETLSKHARLASFEDRSIILGIRPENLEDASLAPAEWPRIDGTVRLREALGAEVMIHVDVAAHEAVTEATLELAVEVGSRPTAEEADRMTAVGRFDPHSRARPGEQVEIAIDTRALHFFDPETGLGIYDQEPDERGGGET